MLLAAKYLRNFKYIHINLSTDLLNQKFKSDFFLFLVPFSKLLSHDDQS